MRRIAIIGAGFSGAVLARQIAESGDFCITVADSRGHVAGNCHTQRDANTSVMVHTYGPHIFHTNREDVWSYVQRFGPFGPFVNRVKASIPRGVFSLPINLHTINQFFGKRFSPAEARTFITNLGDQTIREPANFEEQALKFIGRDLYEAFFHGYTKKQWGCEPTELPASILARLPVRFNYDDNYYNSRYQGIPINGYTALIEAILDHPNINVLLNTSWERNMLEEFDHVVFTGPIDQFYDLQFGRLGYRTVFWDRTEGEGDLQGNAVINYPHTEVQFTRIHEHKHFAPWEKHDKTVVFTEFSKETENNDIPYYPKRLRSDMEIFSKYKALALNETKVSFLGRLSTYRYLDMHQVIGEALDFAPSLVSALVSGTIRPTFPAVIIAP